MRSNEEKELKCARQFNKSHYGMELGTVRSLRAPSMVGVIEKFSSFMGNGCDDWKNGFIDLHKKNEKFP